MYAPRPNLGDFNEEMGLSNDWEDQELNDLTQRRSKQNQMEDNLFNTQDIEEEYETIREDSDIGQGMSFGGSLKTSDKGTSRNSLERVNMFNNGATGNIN